MIADEFVTAVFVVSQPLPQSEACFQENINIYFVVLCCIISSYTCLVSCTKYTPCLSYHSSFDHYLHFGYFTLLHFRYFETECRLQTFSLAIFLNTWVKINITQVKCILFQRKIGIRAGNGGRGRGRCSCLERNSVYLLILKHK